MVVNVTAAIIRENGKFLICQRPEGKSCGLLWEFPGGKIEPGETGEMCIRRECREELGIELAVDAEFASVTQDYPDKTIRLTFYLAHSLSGMPQRKEHKAFAWITKEEIGEYSFCPADTQMLERYSDRL